MKGMCLLAWANGNSWSHYWDCCNWWLSNPKPKWLSHFGWWKNIQYSCSSRFLSVEVGRRHLFWSMFFPRCLRNPPWRGFQILSSIVANTNPFNAITNWPPKPWQKTRGIHFARFSLGNGVPSFGPIEVRRQSESHVLIEVEIRYASAVDVLLKVPFFLCGGEVSCRRLTMWCKMLFDKGGSWINSYIDLYPIYYIYCIFTTVVWEHHSDVSTCPHMQVDLDLHIAFGYKNSFAGK